MNYDGVLISRDGSVFYYFDPSKKSGSPEYFPILVSGVRMVLEKNKLKIYYDYYSFNKNGKYFDSVDSIDDIRRLDI